MSGEDRVHGPYKHGARWRVIIVDAAGARKHARERPSGPAGFASREAADEFIAGFRDAAGGVTVAQAIEDYCTHLRALGQKADSVTTARYRLRALLDATNDRPLYQLTAAAAAKLLAAREASVDTRLGEIAAARGLAAWAIRRGWLSADPWAGLEVHGKRKRGKPHLRIDEARTFVAAAVRDGTRGGIAAALALLTGMRASEVTDRVVRDLDDGGRVLWIDHGKTENAKRALEVPESLREALLKLARGRGPQEPLFGHTEPRGKQSQRVTRRWLAYHTSRIRLAAGLPKVTPHGLRGTQASIAAGAVSVEHVAIALGQAGPGVTRRHYLDAGAEATGRQRAALRVIEGGRK